MNTRVIKKCVVALSAMAMLIGASAHAQIVYVDVSQEGGTYQVGTNWVNVRDGNGTAENLVDIGNVATTFDVTLAGLIAHRAAIVMPGAGTDAHRLFDGFVDINNFWYSHDDAAVATMTFTGLDPSLAYDVTILADRNGAISNDAEHFVLSGIAAFNNISSIGTTISQTSVFNDTTSYDSGLNTDTGYVARWGSIDPGSDGEFTVTGTVGGTGSLYLNAIRLEATTPPPPTSSGPIAQIVYVDMSQLGGNYQVGTNWVNVRNGNGTAENLVDIANVATTFDVTLAGLSLAPTDITMPVAGTDAHGLFDGFVDINRLWYSHTDSAVATMTFAGLDPSLAYDVTILGNRIADAIVSDAEHFVLSGIAAFNNISSIGTTISKTSVSNDTTSFDSRNNGDTGYVARWGSIDPGIDGEFTVTATVGGTGSLYLNAIRLEVTLKPPEGTVIFIK